VVDHSVRELVAEDVLRSVGQVATLHDVGDEALVEVRLLVGLQVDDLEQGARSAEPLLDLENLDLVRSFVLGLEVMGQVDLDGVANVACDQVDFLTTTHFCAPFVVVAKELVIIA